MGIHPLPHLTETSDGLLTADDAATRRSFLKKVAIGGAAAAVGSQLLPVRAFAQEGDDETTTTTAAEGGAEAEETVELTPDEERVTFLAGIALAASAAYRAATGDEPDEQEEEEVSASAETTVPLAPITVPALAEPVVEILRAFGAQHAGQAGAFGDLLTEPVTAPNGTLLVEVRTQLGAATDEAAVLGILRDLDERIAATQLTAIGDLEEVNDTKVVAAALPIVGQQVVVLGQLATPPAELETLIPVEQGTDGALTEAAYPVDATEAPGPTSTTTTTDANAGGDGPETGTTPSGSSTGDGTETGEGATDTTESEG